MCPHDVRAPVDRHPRVFTSSLEGCIISISLRERTWDARVAGDHPDEFTPQSVVYIALGLTYFFYAAVLQGLDIDVAVTPVGSNSACSNEKRKLTEDNELNKELKKVSE